MRIKIDKNDGLHHVACKKNINYCILVSKLHFNNIDKYKNNEHSRAGENRDNKKDNQIPKTRKKSSKNYSKSSLNPITFSYSNIRRVRNKLAELEAIYSSYRKPRYYWINRDMTKLRQ